MKSLDTESSFIGWLYVDNQNHSISLVEEGLVSAHLSAERSVHYGALQVGEENGKAFKAKIWANWNGGKEVKATHEKKMVAVVITEITPELHFYAQKVDQGPALEQLTLQLRQELNTNPPLARSYTPKEGRLLWFSI